jgi:hypothetical protein
MKSTFFSFVFIGFLISAFSGYGQSQNTIVLKPGPEKGKDTYVWSLDANTPNGGSSIIIANAWTWQSVMGIQEAYFEFDLDSIREIISGGQSLLSAKLNLFYHYLNEGSELEQTHYGSNFSVLQRITTPWKEEYLTWNKRPEVTLENQVFIPSTTNYREDLLGVDVTSLVRDMIDFPEESHGFLLRLKTEEIYRRLAFASSDHPDPEKWPELVLTLCSSPAVAGFDYIIKDGMYQFIDTSQNTNSWYWDFGDGYYSTVQNPKHAYFIEDTVQVCLTVTGNCGTDEYCTVFKSSLTSINQNVLNSSVAVYPNPAASEVTIESEGADINGFEAVIRNALGQVVKQTKTAGSVKILQVNIDDLEPGVYFIDVKHGQFHTIKKLIIQ